MINDVRWITPLILLLSVEHLISQHYTFGMALPPSTTITRGSISVPVISIDTENHTPFHAKNDVAIVCRKHRNFLSRRGILASIALSFSTLPLIVSAETIGKNPVCNDASCLGVWDGMLADCPKQNGVFKFGPGCVSSQDDTPGIFAEPWDYSESKSFAKISDDDSRMDLILSAIRLVSSRNGDEGLYSIIIVFCVLFGQSHISSDLICTQLIFFHVFFLIIHTISRRGLPIGTIFKIDFR